MRFKAGQPYFEHAEPQPPAPPLKAQAAEARGLVPIAHQLSLELLNDADPIENSMQIAMECLNNCYMCLSSSIPVNDFANTMADNPADMIAGGKCVLFQFWAQGGKL